MHFDTKRFAKVTPPKRATRNNEIWSIELTALDIPGRPILLVALDVFFRLPAVLDTTSGKTADIILKLDDAGRRSGYPERLWLDQSFEFSSRAWQEWAAQREIEILYGAPYQKAMIARRFLDELRIFLGDHGSTKPGDLKRNLAEWRRSYKAAAAATN
jgi:transposase InsO family protein